MNKIGQHVNKAIVKNSMYRKDIFFIHGVLLLEDYNKILFVFATLNQQSAFTADCVRK